MPFCDTIEPPSLISSLTTNATCWLLYLNGFVYDGLYIGAPITTRVSFFFSFCLFGGVAFFRVFFCTIAVFLFVWRVRRTFFPSGWCFFYLVTTGWIFLHQLMWESNQSISISINSVLGQVLLAVITKHRTDVMIEPTRTRRHAKPPGLSPRFDCRAYRPKLLLPVEFVTSWSKNKTTALNQGARSISYREAGNFAALRCSSSKVYITWPGRALAVESWKQRNLAFYITVLAVWALFTLTDGPPAL